MIVRSAALALGLWSVLTEAVYYTIDTPGMSHDLLTLRKRAV